MHCIRLFTFHGCPKDTTARHMARTTLADHSSLSEMPGWLFSECVIIHLTLKVLIQKFVACRLIWSGLWSCGERMRCCSGPARGGR